MAMATAGLGARTIKHLGADGTLHDEPADGRLEIDIGVADSDPVQIAIVLETLARAGDSSNRWHAGARAIGEIRDFRKRRLSYSRFQQLPVEDNVWLDPLCDFALQACIDACRGTDEQDAMRREEIARWVAWFAPVNIDDLGSSSEPGQASKDWYIRDVFRHTRAPRNFAARKVEASYFVLGNSLTGRKDIETYLDRCQTWPREADEILIWHHPCGASQNLEGHRLCGALAGGVLAWDWDADLALVRAPGGTHRAVSDDWARVPFYNPKPEAFFLGPDVPDGERELREQLHVAMGIGLQTAIEDTPDLGVEGRGELMAQRSAQASECWRAAGLVLANRRG